MNKPLGRGDLVLTFWVVCALIGVAVAFTVQYLLVGDNEWAAKGVLGVGVSLIGAGLIWSAILKTLPSERQSWTLEDLDRVAASLGYDARRGDHD